MRKIILPILSGLTSGLACYGMSCLGHHPLICCVGGICAGLTITALYMAFWGVIA